MKTEDQLSNQYFPELRDDVDRLMALRRSSGTKRFHTWPTLRVQRVDEHSHGAVMVALYLDRNISAELIKAILFHDHAEHYAGDMPAPAKRLSSALYAELKEVEKIVDSYLGIEFKLSEYETLVLRMSDTLELLMFALEERLLGNMNMDSVFKNGIMFIRDIVLENNNAAVQNAVTLAKWLMYRYTYEAGGKCDVPNDIL